MTLSEYLRHSGMPALQLAKSAGVAHTTIGRILKGTHIPQRSTRQRIAAATNGAVSEGEILMEAARLGVVEKAA